MATTLKACENKVAIIYDSAVSSITDDTDGTITESNLHKGEVQSVGDLALLKMDRDTPGTTEEILDGVTVAFKKYLPNVSSDEIILIDYEDIIRTIA